jgi:hypothetical protein
MWPHDLNMQNEENNTSSLINFPPILIHSTTLIMSITNPTPLKNNLVPEICKKEVAISLVCSLCFSFQVVLIPNDFF